MKRCPKCNQIFTDDNFFCLNDGSTLVSETTPQTTAFPPSKPPPSSADNSSKWLYLIIGAMGTTLLGMALFIFLPRTDNEREKASTQGNIDSQNLPVTVSAENKAQPRNLPENVSPTPESTSDKPANKPLSTPASINPNLTPGGKWSGDWASPSGAYLTADVTFTDSGTGQIEGQIVWTLKRTVDVKKMDKIGYTATEYVRGKFEPSTRGVSLVGYRKDDPNEVLGNLDTYRLVLSQDNQQISGTTRNFGRWNGRFNLRRF